MTVGDAIAKLLDGKHPIWPMIRTITTFLVVILCMKLFYNQFEFSKDGATAGTAAGVVALIDIVKRVAAPYEPKTGEVDPGQKPE